MRFTIERIRMLVVVAAVLLLAALGIFLALARLKNRFHRIDVPQRLARDIQQQANGFSFVHAYGAHSQYRIHASREVQLRDNRILLHDVEIDLFGQDGSRIDDIKGDTFEYDQKSGLAIALGPVEMLLTQPANPAQHASRGAQPAAPPRQIDVKTSALTFDRDTGIVSTVQHVDFSMAQGSGTSMGATYDSQRGYLTLDHAVELTSRRGADLVTIHAQHAEFDRTSQTCWLRAATANYRGAQADAALAQINFRPDGSAERLAATGSFTLATANGGHIAAPAATMDFDEHSEPRHALLEGGVTMDSVRDARTVHGTSPAAEFEFAAQGMLRHAHLERGVEFTEKQGIAEPGNQGVSPEAGALSLSRTWQSPVADLDFREARKGQVEPASLHGAGGVVITSRHGDAAAPPSRMSADEVNGTFGPNSTLSSITGAGHAAIEQTTAAGSVQKANGDHLVAEFAQNRRQAAPAGSNRAPQTPAASQETRQQSGDPVQSAELDGHVVLLDQPAAKNGQAQPPLRATAGKAVYESAGEWLHLTLNPRLTRAGLEMTANEVDVSRQSDDAFAHGNVKGTWSGGAPGAAARLSAAGASGAQQTTAFGGNGPAHVIAAEAHLNQSTGEVTFRGAARLWQQANSVTAPEIVLNQHTQTMEARTFDAAQPVRAVLLSAGGPPFGAVPSKSAVAGDSAARNQAGAPSVIRVRGGDLWYSDVEHRAVMHGGIAGSVVAETQTGTVKSDQLDLRLMPAGLNGGQAQVDQMTASGNVVLTSQTRRGTGEQLVYSSVTGDYVLTGTASASPKMSDPAQGSVTGEALIFHSRDDSVSIEGRGQETITETTAPEARGR